MNLADKREGIQRRRAQKLETAPNNLARVRPDRKLIQYPVYCSPGYENVGCAS